MPGEAEQGEKKRRAVQSEERPPFGSPEWLPYFEEMIKTSNGRRDAAERLGYHDPKTVAYHMKKFSIVPPPEWRWKPRLGLAAQRHIPETIIGTNVARAWVAGLIQGEGCIQSIYREDADSTYLELDTSMTDPGPIFRLAGYYGLERPSKPVKNHDWKPQWRKNISGLRAIHVLREILPRLVGEKQREAVRALEFFEPRGFHRWKFRNGDIWSRGEFPLRSKKRGVNFSLLRTQSGFELASRGVGHGRKGVPEVVITNDEDRAWVGALVQGEGCISSFFVAATDSTCALVTVSNTDPATVSTFSEFVGLKGPAKPKYRSGKLTPIWRQDIYGIRAIRLLRELLPFFEGAKLREAEKALIFFDSYGYHEGQARATEIWPTSEFPLRSRKPKPYSKTGK